MGYRERVRFISRPLFWRRHRADRSDGSDMSDGSDLAWKAEIQGNYSANMYDVKCSLSV